MKILILTDIFPFQKGEEFLETEILVWSKNPSVDVDILPLTKTKNKRSLPDTIKLKEITKNSWSIKKLAEVFIDELFFLKKGKKLDLKTFYIALYESLEYTKIFSNLKYHFSKNHYDIVYSYWNEKSSYAAADLNQFVISRVHRYDLYCENKYKSYMPLKCQFVNKISCIATLTEEASEYFSETYKYDRNKIIVSPLGIDCTKGKFFKEFDHNTKVIISVSNCVHVKRIDLIINFIKTLQEETKYDIKWIHFGDGELFEDLNAQAINKLKPNSFEFRGYISNTDLLDYYSNYQVDLFVNLSDSEGVPVSIMEALYFGVPVVARNVGGNSVLLKNENGSLLEDISDFKCALPEIALLLNDSFSNKEKRRAFIENNFNSTINYQDFIDYLKNFVKKAKDEEI